MLVWRAAGRLGIGGRGDDACHCGRAAADRCTSAVPASAGPLAVYRAASGERRERRTACWRRSPTPTWIPTAAPGTPHRRRPGPDEDVADGARTLGRPGARPRGTGRGGCLPGAVGRADAGSGAPGPTRTGRCAGQAPGGRPRRGVVPAVAGDGGPAGRRCSAHWLDLLRAQIAFAVQRGRDAPPLLLSAAKQLEPLDVEAGPRDQSGRVLSAAWFVGTLTSRRRCAGGSGGRTRRSPPPATSGCGGSSPRRARRRGSPTATPRACRMLKQALRAFRSPDLPGAARAALGVARLHHRPGPVGRRELGRPRHPLRRAAPAMRARSPCFPSLSACGSSCTRSSAS